MMRGLDIAPRVVAVALAAVLPLTVAAVPEAAGQGRGAPAPTAPFDAAQGAPSPGRGARASPPIDLTGQWVSVVNEDWRWRMVTPPVGDVASVPLNVAGRQAANAWNLDADRARGDLCKPFGPPGLIRQPGRVRISWENDSVLLLEFDAGRQARRFQFGGTRAEGPPTLQGYSDARWFRQPQNRGLVRGGVLPGGSLEVVTTNLAAGYLRPNGVPYSERAVVKEFFDTFTLPGRDGTWLIVTTVVNDPTYLAQEFVISSQFKKETDLSKWNPRPCDIPPPLR